MSDPRRKNQPPERAARLDVGHQTGSSGWTPRATEVIQLGQARTISGAVNVGETDGPPPNAARPYRGQVGHAAEPDGASELQRPSDCWLLWQPSAPCRLSLARTRGPDADRRGLAPRRCSKA